ncbi:hypothetical protein BpHYR1_025047 [Brachionus plicatilis]|uniref:Uncharacterized protein n=1 Tax=Brachionus plicatilis TaxID=10195 RepID=A0A3M7QIE6_BRAPC|nr:hypothetical protein BpHYR1_025047 [Brachionus plicatilis]
MFHPTEFDKKSIVKKRILMQAYTKIHISLLNIIVGFTLTHRCRSKSALIEKFRIQIERVSN